MLLQISFNTDLKTILQYLLRETLNNRDMRIWPIHNKSFLSITRSKDNESNSGPLAPKARIIPLDQMPTCLVNSANGCHKTRWWGTQINILSIRKLSLLTKNQADRARSQIWHRYSKWEKVLD
ncbi:hypothetical protein I3842_15G113400 [Carya illinoinensis]|uniref:Uncharacterized protein n=1 Tax=Carya illinoinensis TaxID=32201 RepID=A0A922D268_CARIL|nr:hypothetical protein I3842_15G113400 [Carya illinoinensis]